MSDTTSMTLSYTGADGNTVTTPPFTGDDLKRAALDPLPVTPDMLAERWHCSAETIRQMVHRQELRAFRVGRMIRIPWDAVEEVECQRSQSDDCAADSACHGQTQTRENGGAISLRHAREKRQKPRRATDI